MKTEIIVAGYGGQGVLLLGQLCANSALEDGKKVTWIPSYGAEMRGGTANCAVVISDKRVGSPLVNNPDILVAMNVKSLEKFGPKVKIGGTILMNSSLVESRTTQLEAVCYEVPAIEAADELGDARIANSVMLGALTAISNIIKIETVKTIVNEFFLDKYPSRPDIADVNRRALEKGFSIGNELLLFKNKG